jgi:hypothetical protein
MSLNVDDLLAPDSGSDWDSDDSDITPRTRTQHNVRERLRKEKRDEAARLAALNRPSNAEVWDIFKKYNDAHEPAVFFPEAAKRVAAHAAKGHTRLIYPDGSEYLGPAIGIKPEGDGLMTWPDGGSYTGPWHNGLPHTTRNEQGTRMYGKNGEQYVGQWRYGRRHGFGTMTASLLAKANDDKKVGEGEAEAEEEEEEEEEEEKVDGIGGGGDPHTTCRRGVVLYEGQFRDGNKAFQAESEANLIKPDHAERNLVREGMSGLDTIGAQSDALVEKMLLNASMPGKSAVRYTSSSSEGTSPVKKNNNAANKARMSSTVDRKDRDNDEDDNAAHVSAYYVKKEKLKKIKHAWHAYPANVVERPLHKVAEAKVSMAIEKSYAKAMQQRKNIDEEMKDEMDVRRVIYVRERRNILNDYDRGLALLSEKYEKQKASTLRLGRMRGGVAIERSKQEAERLKIQFMIKHGKMSERRARAVKTIKAEYFEDFQEKQRENAARNARAKANHLEMAWAKHALVNRQENKDEARAFANERQRDREMARSRMLRVVMQSGGGGSATNTRDDDLLDDDGSKARQMWRLRVLHKVIQPSLRGELGLALEKWKQYTLFVRHRESIREGLNC